MKRVIAFICGALVLILPLFASGEVTRAYDPHGLLTSFERSELETELSVSESRCGFDLRVVVYDVTAAGYLYESEMLDMIGADREDNLAVFLITKEPSGYYYELFLYGEPDSLIDLGASDEILDTPPAYSNIKAGKIKSCATELVSATVEVTESARTSRRVGVIVATAVVTALAGGGTALGIFLSYKRKQRSPSYPLSRYANLNLTAADDSFIGSNVVRTRINSGSSRSGGSRGGGGSRGRR